MGKAWVYPQGCGSPHIRRRPQQDSERLRILITITIRAIWKTRNKISINNQDVHPGETREMLKDLIRGLVRSWNATRFMEGDWRLIRQRELRTLWADKRLFRP